MNKSLEALERIKHNLAEIVSDDYHWEDYVNDVDLIENSLKALEIIIKKVNIRIGHHGEEYYFIKTTNNYYYISKEKYDLLKEVLL